MLGDTITGNEFYCCSIDFSGKQVQLKNFQTLKGGNVNYKYLGLSDLEEIKDQ